MSGTRTSPKTHTTASNEASGSPVAVMSAQRKSMMSSRPARVAFARATSSNAAIDREQGMPVAGQAI